MTRVLVLLSLVCACVASPVSAQQEESSAVRGNALLDQLEGVGDLLTLDGSRARFTERADLPVPGQPGYRIYADAIDIDLETTELIAVGNVSFTMPTGRINASRIEYNIDKGTGVFYDAAGFLTIPNGNRAEFGNQDPDVMFAGERIEKRGPKKYVVTKGWFTACSQPNPRWQVVNQSATINLDDFALLRNTVLKVKGVPLLYLPVLYYPLHDEQRSTGILMPTFGSSGLRGQALSNAFFWAINRSQDATVYHDWFTRAGTGAGAEYRYLAGVGSGGQVRFYRLDQKAAVFTQDGFTSTLPSETSYQLTAALNQDFGHGLRAQSNVEYFSDVSTQQLFQQNTYLRSLSRRTISGGLTGAYGPAILGGYYSRSEQFTDATSSTVYGSTPRFTANVAPSKLFGTPAYASLNAEYIFQPNRRLQEGIVTSDESLARFDIAPTLRVPLSRLTYLSVTTNAAYRNTYFSRSVDPTGAFVNNGVMRQYMSLQTDVIGPVLSKIWDTPGSGYSDRMKHVIEPMFSVEYLTQIANQSRVPQTDSSVFAVGGATSFTYGVINRLLARTRSTEGRGSTREFLTIGLQQTYYTNPQTSLFDTTYASYSGRLDAVELSPIALTARVSPIPAIDANARIEYDVSGNGLQILTAGSTFSTPSSQANLSFSRQRFSPGSPLSSFLSGSSAWRFKEGRMTAFYAMNWDIDAKYIYSQSMGGAYLAQCCGVQADFQVVNFLPTVGSPLPSDRRVNFSFVLAGLGTFTNFFGLLGGQ